MSRLRDIHQLKVVPVNKIKTPQVPLVKSLQTSLLETQQKNPVKLRTLTNDPNFDYEIVDGRRRLNALIQAGQETVLAHVVIGMDDTELALQALIGNSGTPNELDEARHILSLEQVGYTADQIAKMTGYSPATICQRKKLVEKLHTKGQELLQSGQITVSTALQATKLPLSIQEEEFEKNKISFKTVAERLRDWQTQQLNLFDLEPVDSDIKPGLFLTAEQVEQLQSGSVVEVDYLGKKLNIKAES